MKEILTMMPNLISAIVVAHRSVCTTAGDQHGTVEKTGLCLRKCALISLAR